MMFSLSKLLMIWYTRKHSWSLQKKKNLCS